jgi:lipid-A-disaccharide synthase
MAREILIVSGEPSGDLLGAGLVRAMGEVNSDVRFFGVGLGGMRDAGVDLLISPERMYDLSIVASPSAIIKIPALLRLRTRIVEEAKRRKPSAVVLIDYPGFNMGLARKLAKLSIPMIYYSPPKAWLWGRWRVRKLEKFFKKLLTLFPFEEKFYRSRVNIDVEWVGHPLSNIAEKIITENVERENAVGVLPGSRLGLIKRNLPIMLDGCRILKEIYPDIKFILPLAPMVTEDFIRPFLGDMEPHVEISTAGAARTLARCRVAMAIVGTASFESVLLCTPVVVAGRYSRLLAAVARNILGIKPQGLPNIIAEKKLTPELWQEAMIPKALSHEISHLLENKELYDITVMEFLRIRDDFIDRGDPNLNAARAINKILG